MNFFDKVKNNGIREAYQIIYSKFMRSETRAERARYWRYLNKLTEWEINEMDC